MNEKLAAELEKHRERRMHILTIEDKKFAMLAEARELNHLANAAQEVYDKAKSDRQDLVLARALINAARRAQNVAMVRWSFMGLTLPDISNAFGLTTQHISQVKKDIMALEKSFATRKMEN